MKASNDQMEPRLEETITHQVYSTFTSLRGVILLLIVLFALQDAYSNTSIPSFAFDKISSVLSGVAQVLFILGVATVASGLILIQFMGNMKEAKQVKRTWRAVIVRATFPLVTAFGVGVTIFLAEIGEIDKIGLPIILLMAYFVAYSIYLLLKVPEVLINARWNLKDEDGKSS